MICPDFGMTTFLSRCTVRSKCWGASPAENALDRAYLDYVRNCANGYLSQPVALNQEGRGNELTVVTR
jgi:hypothetical protein